MLSNTESNKATSFSELSLGGGAAVPAINSPQWPSIDGAAYYGLAGDIVRAVEPHSEADPTALLVQVLVMAGSLIGRGAYFQVESDRHHPNLFGVLVGESGKGRKGTSWGRVKAIARVADPVWAEDRIKSGLSSGEGLIYAVRDAVQHFDPKEGQYVTVDPGTTDKRLLVVEAEFASALCVAERAGNILSPLIRVAWDGNKLTTMTKNASLAASDPHISIIGHITGDELRARISRTDIANGFGNRFLFILTRRSKKLPFGGDLSDAMIDELGERLKERIDLVKNVGRITLTAEAEDKWVEMYNHLSEGQGGLLGAVTARSEAQVIRLALVYALLDGCAAIDVMHLQAAAALWDYAEASAAYVFGEMLGDAVADAIMQALRAAPDGMTRAEISALFARHQSSVRIGAALNLLATKGVAMSVKKETNGRYAEVWVSRS
jgi:hypothetical protein